MGIPVVGSTCGEIPKVIGRPELIFPEGNALALADVLDRLILDARWRDEVSEYGIKRVEERFTSGKIAARLEEVWLDVGGNSGLSVRSEPANTVECLFEKYSTYTRRGVLTDGTTRETVFTSLGRTVGPWLPHERSAKILDVACGGGALLLFLENAHYDDLHAFDISPENVGICHRLGLPFVRQFDALCLKDFEPDVSYDMILALDILEHLPKQTVVGFLRQARDRLRPGGSVIIQTPNMGCVFGLYHRFYDLSHDFCLTEKSALDLMMVAGFDPENVQIRPAWNATTLLGRLREQYLKTLHHLVFLAEDSSRPKIPTKNLLIRGTKP